MTSSRREPAAIGMAFLRSPTGVDPFYGEVIAGLEDALHPHGMRVLMQTVPTARDVLATYRRWALAGAVAGIVISDLTVDDTRASVLTGLGMAHVTLGQPVTPTGGAVVRVDNRTAMAHAVEHLVALGHRVVGRVSGPRQYAHTRTRDRAFLAAMATVGGTARMVVGDYSAAGGAAGTLELLRGADRPTAIVYDNDVMAVAGLEAAVGSGLDVPAELSILAWDDSTSCRLATPPLSAMSHDVRELGDLAGRVLLRVIDGGPAEDISAPIPVFVARGSTAPPATTRVDPAG